jgi:hypothetical protein
MKVLLQDVAYGFRQFRKTPGFTATVLFTDFESVTFHLDEKSLNRTHRLRRATCPRSRLIGQLVAKPTTVWTARYSSFESFPV